MIRACSRASPWALLSVPPAGAGWLTARSVAYGRAVPDSHDHAQLLSATSHGYFELEPIFIACALLLMCARLFASVSKGIRDCPQGRLPMRLLRGHHRRDRVRDRPALRKHLRQPLALTWLVLALLAVGRVYQFLLRSDSADLALGLEIAQSTASRCWPSGPPARG
jgi:hypothetical protein